MSAQAGGPTTGGDVFTREQILDELAEITRLEHAHIVHYLRLHYALGGERDGEDPRPKAVADAANMAFSVTFSDMRHFHSLNRILVDAGRDPVVNRAAKVTPESGPPIDLAPMTPAQFEHFPARERALGEALARRYRRVRLALDAPTPPLSGAELDAVTSLLESAEGGDGSHAGIGSALAEILADIPPAEYLLVTNVEPTEEIDQRLLEVSEGSYRSLTRILRSALGNTGFDGGPSVNGQGVEKMNELHEINGILGLRGVLPLLTDPAED